MEFIEYNQSEGSEMLNGNLKKIVERVSQIKASEKVGVKYMQQWEVEAIIRQEAKEQERLANIRKLMEKKGLSAQETLELFDVPEEERAQYIKLLK